MPGNWEFSSVCRYQTTGYLKTDFYIGVVPISPVFALEKPASCVFSLGQI